MAEIIEMGLKLKSEGVINGESGEEKDGLRQALFYAIWPHGHKNEIKVYFT